MRRIVLACALILIGAATVAAKPHASRELVMVELPGCHWCQRWSEEVGVVFHKTPEGRAAPLRRVMKGSPELATLNLQRAAIYTPTFLLMLNGEEVGRIEGYPGEDFFWGLFQKLLADADEQAAKTEIASD